MANVTTSHHNSNENNGKLDTEGTFYFFIRIQSLTLNKAEQILVFVRQSVMPRKGQLRRSAVSITGDISVCFGSCGYASRISMYKNNANLLQKKCIKNKRGQFLLQEKEELDRSVWLLTSVKTL